ncbi:methyltransferase domain-containing protein [Paenibacillus oenotherae]|uniref:Methyltransferase domain-containing protein n=1 Tax=Paenibacillus oenotherae TaxID=1435645 RepID=A0ABS7D0J2_9BACL|nr:methyltransferase domain-containing protein [Paenibacillus oenotherae]MBW7473388.1 methyltransferase domain-containing protein [Paenibacillus oenotherae]
MITSIILVTYNKLEYTQLCIESIRRYTAAGSYEIIVIDNGSTDGTPLWLEEQPDVICQLNSRNEGFPKACNQGIALASGEGIMLLNNDTVVTPRWLEGLLRGLHSDPKVGAVGPVTNYASYMTQIPTNYETLEEMEQFADRHNVHDSAKWEERLKLIGYCLLMKREACEAVGLFDERFGIGNYEDDDYSLRLLLKGYKLLLCGDTFIHHFGSISFGADQKKFQAIVTDNHVHFVQKWGFEPGSAMNVRLDLLSVVEQELPDYKRGQPIAVLEIGCGCGGTLLKLKRDHPDSTLYGLERDPQASRIAQAAGVAIVGQGTAKDALGTARWGIEAGSLDAIIIGNAHEFASQSGGMKGLAALLKPEGWLLCSFANRLCFRFVKQFMSPSEHLETSMLYTSDQVKGLMSKAGLDVLKLAYAADSLTSEDERFIKGLADLMGQSLSEQFTAVYFISLARLPAAEIAETTNAVIPVGIPDMACQADGEDGDIAGTGNDAVAADIRPSKEQNDIRFTGERLVVSREVKEQCREVYEEHMLRYELAGKLAAGLQVLDAACGTGYGTGMLKAAGAVHVTGIDIDEQSVERAKLDYGGDGISFVAGDVLKLPFDNGAFDAVVSFETIEHVSEGRAWIRESARVLREGGRFIVSTPNRALTNAANYYEEQPFNPHHRFEYRTEELVGELLQFYDIEALYGQNVYDDSQFAAMRWLRAANQLPEDREEAHRVQSRGHALVPLSELKSGEPMYVLAVCRKKRAGG